MAVDWQKKMSVNLNLISLVNLKKIYIHVCVLNCCKLISRKKKKKPFRFLRKNNIWTKVSETINSPVTRGLLCHLSPVMSSQVKNKRHKRLCFLTVSFSSQAAAKTAHFFLDKQRKEVTWFSW